MSRGVNKVILVGNLGGDPETHGPACKFSIATSESWTDKQSGEKQERTEWHRITAFGRLGEICQEYLSKGRQVYIEGSIRTNKYTDKDGVERWSTEIIAREMQMLGTKGDGASAPRESGGGKGRNEYAETKGRAAKPATATTAQPEFDDDIPF